jgi:hypothetical protein
MGDMARSSAEAWAKKVLELNERLGHMRTAPALFTPLAVAETERDLEAAGEWLAFWRGQIPRRQAVQVSDDPLAAS